MSVPKKKEETRASEFTIDLDDFGTIPGVTQLLNPKIMEAKEAARKQAAKRFSEEAATPKQTTATPTPASSLEALGVHYELQFKNENGTHRYHNYISHYGDLLPRWQSELLQNMKFLPEIFMIKDDFIEHSASDNAVLLEAVGAEPTQFIQVLRAAKTSSFVILISDRSLKQNITNLTQLLFSPTEPSAVIELDLSGS